MDTFCCPTCKNTLNPSPAALTCTGCGRSYPILNGIPDFFLVESEQESVDLVNAIWGDEMMVKARNTIYRLCTRELKGMAFCMQEIARRTGPGIRILEVGMGTGHFTRWLAEVAAPGTEIYAFDCSWPMLQTAQANLQGISSVTMFRANARGKLPFQDASFDILFLRLAPLGPHGVPNVSRRISNPQAGRLVLRSRLGSPAIRGYLDRLGLEAWFRTRRTTYLAVSSPRNGGRRACPEDRTGSLASRSKRNIVRLLQ